MIGEVQSTNKTVNCAVVYSS